MSLNRGHGLSKRDLIKAAALTSLAGLATGEEATGAAPGQKGLGMNVVLFLTDQERKTMHFPQGWEQRNLPGLTRLKRHGLSFENAFANACMCSPARSTWMSGFFPAQHGVKYTLEEDMPASQYPQVELATPPLLKNIATVAAAAGYNPVYKGKWHLNKPAGQKWVPRDVEKYGFTRWNPQDAGADQSLPQAGGGSVNNDGRFMHDNGPVVLGKEGAIAFLKNQAVKSQPFFLIVSLVNPHDVLFYPNTYLQAGYDDSWLQGTIDVPSSINEDLSTKPVVQTQILNLMNGSFGTLSTVKTQRAYLNFYGNLIKSSDNYLVEILNTLDALRMTDKTLVIKTADHGEMGLTHGGQRQKNFNFYEESTRVPLVYSNPVLYPEGHTSKALVSHVDFLPTIASVLGAPPAARSKWQGIDYSSLIAHPETAPPVQDYVVFTYDDYQSGQNTGPYPTPPNHIVSIREQRYKLAQYYDVNGVVPPQWEMYDLLKDPTEIDNLAAPGRNRTKEQQAEYVRLQAKLRVVQATRLQPLT